MAYLWPSATVAILLGSGLGYGRGAAVGRVAGAAISALGVACWLAHTHEFAEHTSVRGVVSRSSGLFTPRKPDIKDHNIPTVKYGSRIL